MLNERLQTLFELDRYDEVIALCLENLYTDDADTDLLYSYLVTSLFNIKHYEKAQRFVKEAITIYPSAAHFYALYARILVYGFNVAKKAQVEIKKALQLDANNASYYALYTEILVRMGRYSQAKEMIDKALEIDTSELSYHLTLASLLYLDNKKIAEEIVDEVLTKDPLNERALYMKSELFTNTASQRLPILKDLLSRNPMQKHFQMDLKFVRFYYRFVPLCMMVVSVLFFLLRSNSETFSYLEILFPITPIILAVIGSNDLRFNIPFIAIIMGINAYLTHIPNELRYDDIISIPILAIIFNYVAYAVFLVFGKIVLNRLLK